MDYSIVITGKEDLTNTVKQIYINKNTNNNYYNIVLDFSKCDFARPSSLVIVAAHILCLQKQSRVNNIQFIESRKQEVNDYISRMDFLKLLGIPFSESFTRHDNTGRFVTIKQFSNEAELVNLINDIFYILHKSYPVQYCQIVEFSLTEIMDNVLVHSDSLIDGLLVMQDFPNSETIEFCLVDCGIGIKESLKNNTAYKNITNKKALEIAIQKNISSCQSERYRGNGLYLTPQLVTEIEGQFILYSHNNILTKTKRDCKIENSPYWPGTIIKLNFWKHYNDDYDSVIDKVFDGKRTLTFINDDVDEVLW